MTLYLSSTVSNYASIYHRFRDIAAYLSKIATFLVFGTFLGVTPSDLHNDPWWRKTRMMGLSDRQRISMIRSAVLIQIARVTDRRTDRQTELVWHIRAMAYAVSRKVTCVYVCLSVCLPVSSPIRSQFSLNFDICTVFWNPKSKIGFTRGQNPTIPPPIFPVIDPRNAFITARSEHRPT